MSAGTEAPEDRTTQVSLLGRFASLWGVLGALSLLGSAIWRLTPIALEPFTVGPALTGFQWVLYVGFIVFNAHAEGYRGFQKGYSPRVVARSLYLAEHPKPLHVLLAPAFCMGLFYATKKRMIVGWVLITVIVGVIAAVRQLDQPWRAIIDGGVVVGLAWGAIAVVVFYVRGLMGRPPLRDPELPEGAPKPSWMR
ncbi:MAG: hypothetical protein ACE366_02410 [Bradymonadia bacterium]